jgi:DNA-binding LacI/PurR family transcriptional regulator
MSEARRAGSPRRPASMADVASRAGVSHQTVSRVLNDHPHVRAETRSRVLAAAAELDFRPNSAARALVTGSTRMLGVVSFDTTLYGPASTLFGIQQAARDADYFVTVVSLKTLDRRSIGEAVDRLRAQAVDGIIVITPHVSSAQAVRHLPPGIPLVAVEGATRDIPSVSVDQHAGAAAATMHLLNLGHRTVWHVAGPTDWLEARARTGAWRAMLQAAGAKVPEPLMGDWSPRSGYEAGQALARRRDVSAVFVSNDQMALGVLRAMHEAGRRVPENVSVIGFDDIPEAAYFTPPLTTVRQDFAEVGRRCLSLLLDRIAGTGPLSDLKITVPPDLVVRQSATTPASGREYHMDTTTRPRVRPGHTNA